MKVEKLTRDMVGKKITCKIHGDKVTKGILGFDGIFYIAQNKRQGYEATERYGFTKTWGIDGVDINKNPNGIAEFELLDYEPQYEIY